MRKITHLQTECETARLRMATVSKRMSCLLAKIYLYLNMFHLNSLGDFSR